VSEQIKMYKDNKPTNEQRSKGDSVKLTLDLVS
jgi:hypothetical protein